jgi:hypothetical protein
MGGGDCAGAAARNLLRQPRRAIELAPGRRLAAAQRQRLLDLLDGAGRDPQSLPYDGPWNIDQASQISLGGGGADSANFNIDGVSNNSYGAKIAFVPPPDMVDEVRINTANYDASEGVWSKNSICLNPIMVAG